MDGFELKPERKVGGSAAIWNVLTVFVLAVMFIVVLYFLILFIFPRSPLNPFPPALLPTSFQSPTPTNTYIPLESTWTPTATLLPSPSRTKAPTWTLPSELVTPPTPTDTLVAPTITATSTLMPAFASISYIASTKYRPDKNCNWLGVGGYVLGSDGKPLQFQEVKLFGTLDGKNIDFTVLSGMVTASVYGPSGFEFVLGDHPIASNQTLWIQLLDNTGKPLSERFYLNTYTECTKNLVLVVFNKTR